MSVDTEDRSHLSTSRLEHVSEKGLRWLQDRIDASPFVTERLLGAIEGCISYETCLGNKHAVLELREYQREVMLSSPEADSYEELVLQLAETIGELTREIDEETKAAKTAAEAARRESSPLGRLTAVPVLDEGKRAPRPRSRQRRPW